MHHRFFLKYRFTKILAICAIFTLLAACGTSANGSNKQTTIPPIKSIQAPEINPGTTSINASELHIQSDGIECSPGNLSVHAPPNHIVLADNRTSYTSTEIQQIRDYLSARAQTDETTTGIAGLKTPLPSTLQWVIGTLSTTDLCNLNLEITNTGNTTIQIPRVGARLVAAPQQNTYQYHLINACSLLSPEQCTCNGCGGGPGSCFTYSALIQLGMGQKGSLFSSTPMVDPTCISSQLTLTPSTTIEFNLSFGSPPPNHLAYSLVTELTLQTASGQHVLALPQLGSSVVFADKSQFSCFDLKNQSFVVETKPLFSDYATNCI